MRAVTLVGGPIDGHVTRTEQAALQVPVSGDEWRAGVMYRPERYYVSWPMPGWELLTIEDLSRGVEWTDVWFIARVWATERRHEQIKGHFDTVNRALEFMWRARIWQDDDACDGARRMVDEAIGELVALTSPGYNA